MDVPTIFLRWDYEVPGWGSLWLRSESQSGFPTQTWLNGVLVEREADGSFAWGDNGIPLPIEVMEGMARDYPDHPEVGYALIEKDIDMWSNHATDESYSEGYRARASAYAHYGESLRSQLEGR